MGTDTEHNPTNANTFNSAPLRARIRDKDTVIIRIRKSKWVILRLRKRTSPITARELIQNDKSTIR